MTKKEHPFRIKEALWGFIVNVLTERKQRRIKNQTKHSPTAPVPAAVIAVTCYSLSESLKCHVSGTLVLWLGLYRAMWHVGDTSGCSQLPSATLKLHVYQVRETSAHHIHPVDSKTFVLSFFFFFKKRDLLKQIFRSGLVTHPGFVLVKILRQAWEGTPQPLRNVSHHDLPSCRYHVSEDHRTVDKSICSFKKRPDFILQRQQGTNQSFWPRLTEIALLPSGWHVSSSLIPLDFKFGLQKRVDQCFSTVAAHQAHTHLEI